MDKTNTDEANAALENTPEHRAAKIAILPREAPDDHGSGPTHEWVDDLDGTDLTNEAAIAAMGGDHVPEQPADVVERINAACLAELEDWAKPPRCMSGEDLDFTRAIQAALVNPPQSQGRAMMGPIDFSPVFHALGCAVATIFVLLIVIAVLVFV